MMIYDNLLNYNQCTAWLGYTIPRVHDSRDSTPFGSKPHSQGGSVRSLQRRFPTDCTSNHLPGPCTSIILAVTLTLVRSNTSLMCCVSSNYCKTHIFRVHQIFANRNKSRIKYPRKFSLPIKGLVNTGRTPGKRQIKMQQNFYIPKLRNYGKTQQKYNVLQ